MSDIIEKMYYEKLKNAFERQKDFQLTLDEFQKLVTKPCFYCGLRAFNGPKKIHGIDRVDNTLGYTVDNCVTCCKLCNYFKLNNTKDDFIDWLSNLPVNFGSLDNYCLLLKEKRFMLYISYSNFMKWFIKCKARYPNSPKK